MALIESTDAQGQAKNNSKQKIKIKGRAVFQKVRILKV